MQRFDESMAPAELDVFASTLKKTSFTHKDVMRCYSIYMRNEYQKNKDNPSFQANQDSFIRQRSGGKRIPMRWSEQEVEALKEGVQTLGKGNWAKIIEMYPTIFGPTARTGRDLKKKWIGLESKNDTQPKGNVPGVYPVQTNNNNDKTSNNLLIIEGNISQES